jgi:hypothetical protein
MASYDNVQLPRAPAAPSYAAPIVDFSAIGNLGDQYFKGQQQQQQLQLMHAFPDGLPRDPETGQIDQNKMIEVYARLKGAEAVPGLITPLRQLQAIADEESPQRSPVPSRSAEAGPQPQEAPVSPPRNLPAPLHEPAAAAPVTATEVTASAQAARQPGADLVPKHMLDAGVSPQQYADYTFRMARKMEIGGFPAAGRTWQARGQAVLDAIKQAGDVPTEAKLAARENMSVPEYQGVVKSQEAVGGALGKRVGEVVEAGGQAARHTVNTLSIMSDALARAGGNLTTGPGAEQMLKLKQAAQNLFPGVDYKGLSEAETIKKLNAVLAAQAAKAMTARPSQLEFKAFMANNPGLETSVRGTKVLIDVLKQSSEQDIKLARLAADPKNLRNWSAVEDKFYRENPIQSPFAVPAPADARAALRSNPGRAKEFDSKYGLGSAAQELR